MKPPFAPSTSTDLTAKLNAWLAGLPDGATAELGTGVYRCDGVVEITHKLTLVGGTVMSDTVGKVEPPRFPKNRCHILVSGDDVTIQGTKVNGPNNAGVFDTALEFQHGFLVAGDRARLIATEVREVHGDAWKISGGAAAHHPPVVGVLVDGGIADVIGRQGVSFGDCTDATVRKVKFSNVARSGVDVEPLGKKAEGQWTVHETVTNATVEGCEFRSIKNAVVANLGGGMVDGFTVRNNKAFGQTFSIGCISPIQEDDGSVERRRRYTFDGNWSDKLHVGPGSTADFVRIDQLKVVNHTQPVAKPRTGAPPQWLRTEDCTMA